MCGFFISNSPKVSQAHSSIIESGLRFRGPDCSSGLLFFKNNWKAYHSRLSIIDVDSGVNQPVLDSLGGLLVFNGEILNFKELGLQYFNKEYSSDTLLLSDLIVNDFLDLNELDGFYSFVYVDSSGFVKYSARDKFGVKPLFYYVENGYYSFCSEPIVLKRIFNCFVNPDAISEYYATRAPIFSGSFFDSVHSVSPGSCLVHGKYFNLLEFFVSTYEEPNLDSLKQSILKGINTRLISDVPVGLLLSKGIDSNLLRSLGKFDKFYSIGFDGDEDLEYLRNKSIKGLTLLSCTKDEFKTSFDYLLNLRGEPLSVPNEVLLYLIAKKASSDGIKVLLSGEGADEFFGGYDRIFKWASEIDNFDVEQFLTLYCYLPPAVGSKLFNQFKDLFTEVNISNPFEIVRWFFIRFHMPVLFRRLDFALMAAGVEGREPIANIHSFVQAMKFSPDDLMSNDLGKVPLRELLSNYMGKSFSYEKKVGFPVNLQSIYDYDNSYSSYDIWFKENLKVLK